MNEIETKILEVDIPSVIKTLEDLGARKIKQTRMSVDWYGPKNLTHAGDDPWYVRVRTFHFRQDVRREVSWKSLASHVGNTRQSREINFEVSDARSAGTFLEALGLERYAHQEKDRISFVLRDWNFDLDQYPSMPPYLEIEGKSQEHVSEAIQLLGLSNYESLSEGERKLISERYGLNWNNMRF